jgi:hypothetical protein
MTYTPKNIQGIEGDDIPYHLSLLGLDVTALPKDIVFYPLNDHYNTHGFDWAVDTKTVRTVVFYDLVNTSDYDHARFCNFISNYQHPNKVYLTVNQSSNLKIAGVRIIPWDFMWNRFKAYYTEKGPEHLHLHHYTSGKYILPELDFTTPRHNTFLSLLGREYGWRSKLYSFVSAYNKHGYISNRSRGIYLEGNSVVGAFNPPDNIFYTDSYISIYVESNCAATDLLHITEKTFDPLVKGHIILPFSNPGTISRLKKLGFEFAPFVEYHYDAIENVHERFNALQAEFMRLLELDIPRLYNHCREIFMHNQRVLFDTPYDRRISEIFHV